MTATLQTCIKLLAAGSASGDLDTFDCSKDDCSLAIALVILMRTTGCTHYERKSE